MPVDDDPNEERNRLDPDDSLDMPDHYRGHESVWESVVVARFGGATKFEQAELSATAYTGFVDPYVDSETRELARDDALAGFEYFGVDFDWAQWRREMGY